MEETKMDRSIKLRITKKIEEIYEFYYLKMGDRIRRIRLDQKMTQEALAKGICSNTYISKIENNKITVKKEHLNLIMERMDVERDSVIYPEEMVESLENALKYFYEKDHESYEELYQKIDKYDFGILLYVIKLGYFVLNEDYVSATPIYDEMYRYINSLEDFGFSIFIVFACFYNVGIRNFHSAKQILESVEGHLLNESSINSLIHHVKFITYGHLYLFNKARDNFELARSMFLVTSNQTRLNELIVYKNIFHLYESKDKGIIFNEAQLVGISDSLRNYYLIILALVLDKREEYLKYLSKESRGFPYGLFLLGRHYHMKGMKEEYKQIKQEINQSLYLMDCRIDLSNLMKLLENDDDLYLKNFYSYYVLPYLEDKQDLFFFKQITDRVSSILFERNRYKDSIVYYRKFEELKSRLQGD